MSNLLKRELEKFKKKSWFGKVSDVFFLVLVVLLIIPSTRKPVMSQLAKIPMMVQQFSVKDHGVLDEEANQWMLYDVDGEPMLLEHLKGEVLFVNFWATWCPPCVAEMPSIEKLHADYGDRVKFLLVSTDDRQRTLDFIQNQGYVAPVYFSSISQMPYQFKSSSIPATYLVDREGRVVLAKKGAADWNSKRFRKLLDEVLH